MSINADSENAASVYAYHRYFGLPFPALLDPGPNPGDFNNPGGLGRVSAAYHVGTFPTFYVINEDGVITWRDDSEQPDAAIRQAARLGVQAEPAVADRVALRLDPLR